MNAPLLEVSGLGLSTHGNAAPLRLVDDVSFSVREGAILGIVGESGSGKSLTCRAVIGLLPGTVRSTGGSVKLDGKELLGLPEPAMREIRGKSIGMIFQSPSAFLDPVMTIGDQIGEVYRQREQMSAREARQETIEMLRQVGIPDPARRANNYPHEFSGGMKQRAMIAAALACRPRVLIADEPTTALDVTIQAQILRLLVDLRDRFGLSILLVTHDLAVVAQTCDDVVVMYGGKVSEYAKTADVLRRPMHPYTKALLGSQPDIAVRGERLAAIPGSPPSANSWPAGCRFSTRCASARLDCATQPMTLTAIGNDRASACLYWKDLVQ